MRKLFVIAVFALVMLFAGSAHAVDTGYPCVVEYDWQVGNNYSATSLYTGTNCTGSFVGYYYFAGPGWASCPTSVQHTADSFLAFMQALRSQMSSNQKVWIGYLTSGSTKCGYVIDFFTN